MNESLTSICKTNMTDSAAKSWSFKKFVENVRTLGTIQEGTSKREKWLLITRCVAKHAAGALQFLLADKDTGEILVYPRTHDPYLHEADLQQAAGITIKDHGGELVSVTKDVADPDATLNLILDAHDAHLETSGITLVGLTAAAVLGQTS